MAFLPLQKCCLYYVFPNSIFCEINVCFILTILQNLKIVSHVALAVIGFKCYCLAILVYTNNHITDIFTDMFCLCGFLRRLHHNRHIPAITLPLLEELSEHVFFSLSLEFLYLWKDKMDYFSKTWYRDWNKDDLFTVNKSAICTKYTRHKSFR